MGFWAGIKRALNSTLGTSEFKPLNTMIDEAKEDTSFIIKDTFTRLKEFIVSENELIPVTEEKNVTIKNVSDVVLFTFNSRLYGNLRFYARMNSAFSYFRYTILEDDRIISEKDSENVFDNVISIKPEHIYTFKVRLNDTSTFSTMRTVVCGLYGEIVDFKGYDYEKFPNL